MTERRSPRLHNRARRRLKDLVKQWGDLLLVVFGAITVVIAVVLVVLAIDYRASTNASAKQSYELCVRARRYGPAVADDYASRRVFENLPPRLLAYYKREHIPVPTIDDFRSTIPDACSR
jgi:hypothetical protein